MMSKGTQVESSHSSHMHRAALISSPMLGLLVIAPMLAYVNAVDLGSSQDFLPKSIKSALGYVMISLFIYLMWRVNIGIRNKLVKESSLTNRKTRQRLLIPSFLFVILVMSGMTVVREILEPDILGTFKYYPFGSMIVTNFIIILMLNFIDGTQENAQLKLDKSQLELSNLMAAHNQLKQQIQPHFLFNALSNLQVLINKQPDAASNYVAVLSNFLRTSIQFNAKDTVLVEDDLDFLQDYITIQQLRFDSSIILEVDIPDAILSNRRLPVFCLQLLGENAIKHNMFTAESPLYINIDYDELEDRLIIQNNREKKYKVPNVKSGTGLINLKKRFGLETEENIEITKTELTYKVSLPLLR